MQKDAEEVVVVGAGLAGTMISLMLAQYGKTISVYEQRKDPRTLMGREGRSINLGLSKRGIEALRRVGLLDVVMSSAVPMRGRVVHATDGVTRYQPYGKDNNEVLYSIDRHELNILLLEQLQAHEKVSLTFEHKLKQVDKKAKTLTFDNANGSLTRQADWMIGADGAFSKSRQELQRGEIIDYQQEFLEWGYKELTLAPNEDGSSAIQAAELHVWPRSHCLIVSHPNQNNSHTLTLFLPFEGKDSFDDLKTDEDIESLFDRYFPDLVSLLPGLLEEWEAHPVGNLITIRTSRWSFDGWGVLVGDACHAQYPFYGQGMNSAFEDCCLLFDYLTEHQFELDTAFRAYEHFRRPHTNALAQLSKDNFQELKQTINSPLFIARKKFDLAIYKLFPKKWLPLYTMIAHTTMPYADARAKALRQTKILNRVMTVFAGTTVSVALYLLNG